MNSDDEDTESDVPAPSEDRTYSGDTVLLVLFVLIACALGILLFASSQAQAS